MIYIVLPAYNEEESLPPLLESIRDNMDEWGLAYTVMVVNDGSTDSTADVLRVASKSMPARLVEHPENRGLSETLKTGLLEALREAGPKDIIITMDADNTHTPGLIMSMARMVREGYDVVIGSRYQRGARVIGVPLKRRFLSFAASVLFRLLFPIRGVKDYTSGYRAYRARVVKDMFDAYGEEFISEPGFSCMVDVLLKLRKYPVIVGEAPLILRYDRRGGASKMDVRRTTMETLRLIVKRLGARN